MTLLLVLCFLAVIIATYLSSINLALIHMSRSAVQRYLTKRGRPSAADWLYDQLDAAIFGSALLRTLARVAIFVLLLAAYIDLEAAATVTWPDLIVSGLIAVVVIWLSTIVVGTAIARHAGTAVICASMPVLRAITWICKPLAKGGMLIENLIRRAIGSRFEEEDEAEAELLQSIEDVQREGALDVMSAEILENVVEFTNTDVRDVMTPRLDIEGIEYTDDLVAIRSFIVNAGHSRIPVFRGGVDNIIGVLYVKDLIRYIGEDAARFKLEPLLRPPLVVPESKPVQELLADFQKNEVHMAIVIDEYGSTAGLVTIEDVLEEIVGEIRDEHEPQHENGPEFLAIDDTHVEVDGRYRIDELNERLNLALPDEEDYDTIAGFMLAQLGRIPAVGESFESNGVRFTTLAATPTHVQRVGLELLSPSMMNGEEARHAHQATIAGK